MQNNRNKRRKLSRQGVVLLLALMLLIIFALILVTVLIFGAPRHSSRNRVAKNNKAEMAATEPVTIPTTEPPTEPPPPVFYPETDDQTMLLDGELQVGRALLIDYDENRVIAMKGQPDARIYPASMTKMLTIVTALEHIEDYEARFTFTEEQLNPLYEQEASMAGFLPGETVTMDDLLYAAALPSGADGTLGLALSTAGSEELFVSWMNEIVDKLELKNTHFTNPSGLHDENHYSTPEDIALILEYCMQNDECRRILATYTYTTSKTEQHPDGIELYSTMFSRMYGTEVDGIKICGGKTGYTDEAGQCLANWAETPDGHRYIAVTAQGLNKWHNVFDSFRLYGIITGTYELLVPEETEDVSLNDTDTAE